MHILLILAFLNIFSIVFSKAGTHESYQISSWSSFWLLPYMANLLSKSSINSVQFSHSVMFDSLWPHGLQHARLHCPLPTPRACSNSCLSSQWCHPTISSLTLIFQKTLLTFLKRSLLLVLMHFTSLVSCIHSPISLVNSSFSAYHFK